MKLYYYSTLFFCLRRSLIFLAALSNYLLLKKGWYICMLLSIRIEGLILMSWIILWNDGTNYR